MEIVHAHYPRGVAYDDPRYKATEEYQNLVRARRRAGADCGLWRGLLARLAQRFPECNVVDGATHLLSGNYDAAYTGKLLLGPQVEGGRSIGFCVSFLAPYYVVYSSRFEPGTTTVRSTTPMLFMGRTAIALPAWVGRLWPRGHSTSPSPRQIIGQDFAPGEELYVTWLAREIETSWTYERMPPSVGHQLVPDVATSLRGLGEASLYDCLFSSDW